MAGCFGQTLHAGGSPSSVASRRSLAVGAVLLVLVALRDVLPVWFSGLGSLTRPLKVVLPPRARRAFAFFLTWRAFLRRFRSRFRSGFRSRFRSGFRSRFRTGFRSRFRSGAGSENGSSTGFGRGPQFRQRFRSGGFVLFETFHVVSCGQHGTKRCFMWFRVASVVLGFHIVSCSQWGFRDTSRGFVWPARYSRCVTWHVVSCGRVAFEMCYVVSCGQLIHAVSCGQRGTPDVSYGTWCRVAE